MIRGKYLRERKGIRFKRRVKIVMTIFVLLLVHRIVFNSFSLYESNATTDANIEVAYFLLDDTYEEKTIMLEDMKPGDTKEVDISISNYFVDENSKMQMGNEIVVMVANTLPKQAARLIAKWSSLTLIQANELESILELLNPQQMTTVMNTINAIADGKERKAQLKFFKDVTGMK